MRKTFCLLLAAVLWVALCPAASAGFPEQVSVPDGTEIPEGVENPEDPVELGSWGIPFTVPGDSRKYIYAHTEDDVLLGLALFEPEDPDAETVDIPDGMETILPGFFERMPNVNRVRIPDSVRALTMECFSGVHRDFVIECRPGSFAEAFAAEYGFQYDNGEKQVIGWEISDPEEKVIWVAANYIRRIWTNGRRRGSCTTG